MKAAFPSKIFCAALLIALATFIAGYLLPLSWDEGWTYCSAKNVVHEGVISCKFLGAYAGTRLAGSLPMIGLASTGLILFSDPILAPRAFFLVCTVLLFLLLLAAARFLKITQSPYLLAACMLGFAADQRIHPILVGSQGWGENFALCCLLAGFISWSLAASRRTQLLFLPLSAGFFAYAIFIKYQILPFLLLAIGAACILQTYQEKNSKKLVAGVFLIGGIFLWKALFHELPYAYIASSIEPAGEGIADLSGKLAIVTDTSVRIRALWFTLQHFFIHSVLILLGIGAFYREGLLNSVVTKSFLLLILSWITWFLFLSIDFPRYIYMPYALSLPLLAYGVIEIIKRKDGFKSKRNAYLRTSAARIALVMIGAVGCMNFYSSVLFVAETAPLQVETDLVAQRLTALEGTPRIESYETPLFYLSEALFSFPADEFSLSLHSHLQSAPFKSYDFFASQPDYLLMGPYTPLILGTPDPEILKRDYHLVWKGEYYSLFTTRN